MSIFIQYLVNGISQGSIYALIALGYTMVYGIIKLINFAHGEFVMVGAFIGYFCLQAGTGLAGALLAAMVGVAALAFVVEKAAYKPLRNANRISALITALGVSLLLQNLGLVFLKPDPRGFPDAVALRTYTLGGVTVTNLQVILLGVSLGLMAGLHFIVHRTRIGLAMRASAEDREAAALMGINVDSSISATFIIGGALAGAAGVLVGLFYHSIDPMMGLLPGLKAFVAAVLGGIGNIAGAMFGGIVMGLLESLVVGYLDSSYRDAIAFTILIAILLVKPAGLFGKVEREKV